VTARRNSLVARSTVWAHAHGVVLQFIRPGKPVENAFVESFNGKFRDECLSVHWFRDLRDAQRIIDDWRHDYNTVRPPPNPRSLDPRRVYQDLAGPPQPLRKLSAYWSRKGEDVSTFAKLSTSVEISVATVPRIPFLVASATHLRSSMDIKRSPPSKRKQYIVWGSGIAAVLLISLGISRLRPAAPSVEFATLWADSVKRGELVREVRAGGTLVPEHIRIIAAVTAGRVEALPVRPGVTVTPSTLLVELSNTDVQLQALQAEQTLSQARSGLATMKTQIQQQRLSQEGTIASLKTQIENAQRVLKVQEALDQKQLASAGDLAAARDLVTELRKRQQLERQRLDEMDTSAKEQLSLNQEQIQRLVAISREQMNRVRSMTVTAGETGVLQNLGPVGGTTLELGQWVNPGMELARVAQPGRLKAVIRVPETQAKDIALGQKAAIDTRNGIVPGHVMRIDPASQGGTVTVEVAIDGELPKGARADMSIDGTIEIERLANVMYVGRPAYGSPESTVGLFRITDDGKEAIRVNVKLGRASVNTIEVLSGLAVGDSVIISDMTQWDNVQRVRLKR